METRPDQDVPLLQILFCIRAMCALSVRERESRESAVTSTTCSTNH